eukprot:TRINITY_DN4193_c0_g1_i9.p1 TRINITY_DN4193_c0_g1~~TRINITY_DN4193_c0_g1_i9.p1  ORF type:complete len:202 (+),score=30.85 TRINITY_DN4193_c0_g1_i9:1215-1820(+)
MFICASLAHLGLQSWPSFFFQFLQSLILHLCNAFFFVSCLLSINVVMYFLFSRVFLQEFFQPTNGELQKWKDLRETANLEVDKTMLTDAPLLFPPGQLALAALRRSNEVHKIVDFERYLESIFSRQRSSHTKSELFESLNAIDSWARKLKIPTAKDMRHIDRKLKNCCDPSSQDESKKREKRSKHKSKRSSSEMQGAPGAS